MKRLSLYRRSTVPKGYEEELINTSVAVVSLVYNPYEFKREIDITVHYEYQFFERAKTSYCKKVS